MQNGITQEILKRMDAIAEKATCGGEYAWGVIVQQHFVYGIVGCICLVLSVALLFFFFLSLRKALVYTSTFSRSIDEKERAVADAKATEKIVIALGLGVAAISSIYVGLTNFLGIFNPEYYAMREIMNIISK